MVPVPGNGTLESAASYGKSRLLRPGAFEGFAGIRSLLPRIEKLKRFGAREVHFRVASPRYINTCHFGIDTGREDELIATKYDVEQTSKYIGADSLAYLSLDGLKNMLKYDLEGLCDACVSGNYPIPVKIGQTALSK